MVKFIHQSRKTLKLIIYIGWLSTPISIFYRLLPPVHNMILFHLIFFLSIYLVSHLAIQWDCHLFSILDFDAKKEKFLSSLEPLRHKAF